MIQPVVADMIIYRLADPDPTYFLQEDPDLPVVYAYVLSPETDFRPKHEVFVRKRWPDSAKAWKAAKRRGKNILGNNIVSPINDYMCVVHMIARSDNRTWSGKNDTLYELDALDSCLSTLRHDVGKWLLYSDHDEDTFELHMPRIGAFLIGSEPNWVEIRELLDVYFDDMNVVVSDDSYELSRRMVPYS